MKNLRSLLTSVALLVSFAGSPARADVIDYFANAEAGRRLEFGSGADGAFADGPAQTGITVALPIITINTDVKSVYEFTSFTLSGGVTINATGSVPLVIRVLGPATIAGQIHLDGATGDPAVAAAPGAGGAAGSGGGNGGLGGEQSPADINGAAGLPTNGTALGGAGGTNSAGFGTQAAGGGGCNGPGATDGDNNGGSAAVCVFTSLQIADRFEIAFTGGAGGGGGGTRRLDLANFMNGAGGGGGGGALSFTALGEIVISNTISADGGTGGTPQPGANDYGAAGGGGSGGSLWIRTASRVSGGGTLSVAVGVGGQDPGPGNKGGDGSRGVVRIDAGSNAFSGAIAPGGAADRTYSVFPVTVEFDITAGPACGTITGAEASRDFTVNLGLCLLLVIFGSRLRPRNRTDT